MSELYNSASSPLLEDQGRIDRPEAFSPIVEALALALSNGHRQLSNDLFANAEFLHKGFDVPFDVYVRIERSLSDAFEVEPRAMQRSLDSVLLETCLEGKVKIMRHQKGAESEEARCGGDERDHD